MSLADMVQGLASSWSGMIQQTPVARTATADGLTTGIIAAGTSAVNITSANSAHLLTLPAPVVNNGIAFMVGANGCRIQSSTPGSIAINGVSGGGTYFTVPANSYGLAVCLSSTAWVIIIWSSAGASVQAAATILDLTTTDVTASNGVQCTGVARTATADGLTTGVIPAGARMVDVTSANAAHLITLPTPVIDNLIDLYVGSNGFRLQSNDPANVGINTVTGGGVYLQIAANSRVVAFCASATNWIVLVFTNAGAPTLTAATITTLTSTAVNTSDVTASNGLQSAAVARTATADGLTTGVIAVGTRMLTITSANAAHLVTLPAPVVENVVEGQVGANGFRLQTSDPATIGINGATPGGGTYLQIPANTHFRAVCISATAWLVQLFDSVGALISSIAAINGQTISPRTCHTGGIPARVSTDGTELDIVVTELYVAQVFVPANMTITGVSIMTGTNTNGNAKVCLFDSTGARVAISGSTDVSSFSADTYNDIPFSAPYAAKGPATYFVGIICDDNTNDLNTHTFGNFLAGKITGLVYATEAGYATITPPSSFTTGLGPIASLY